MFDLNLLKTFSSIYRTGSVKLASEELGISSSAVSHSLSRLRNEYGDPLFIRNGQGLKPTNFAKELFKDVEVHIEALFNTKKIFEKFNPLTSKRTFSIASDSDFDIHYLNRLIDIVEKEAPNIKIEKYYSLNNEDDFKSGLRQRNADVIMTIIKSNEMSYNHELLAEEKIVAITKKNHPRIKGNLTIEQFKNENHAVWERESVKKDLFENLIKERLPDFNVVYKAESALNLLLMTSGREWLMLGTERSYDKMKDFCPLDIHLLPYECDVLKVYLTTHKSTINDEGVSWLKEKIKEAYK